MRSTTFKAIEPNYRKRVVEITLREGRTVSRYDVPFFAFKTTRVSAKHRFVSIDIDKDLGRQGVTFLMADGTRGDLPPDFVRYHCDPTYDWSPVNQLKRVLRDKLDASKLSVRVLADVEYVSVAGGSSAGREPRIQATSSTVQARRTGRLSGHLHAEAEADGLTALETSARAAPPV